MAARMSTLTRVKSRILESGTIEIAALSRPFSMGMLYDCRKDELIPGVTLWNTELLQKDLRVQAQENTTFEIIASDSISEKASALHVTESVKASCLCGLIKLEGSASFMNDTKKHKNQVRVSLQYTTTTRFEQLSMSQLGSENIMYNEVFDQGTATHVVVGILYGAQAFFIFDQEVSSMESMNEVSGKLSLSVQNIPKMCLASDGSVSVDEKEKESVETFSCKFYGDFSISQNPSTYKEVLDIYRTLPRLLGEKGERAVPVKVWLYPLEKLNTKASKMVQNIGVHILCELEAMMEEISMVDMNCNDLKKHPAAIAFSNMEKKIDTFQGLKYEYMTFLQRRLAKIIPAVRGGLRSEVDLTKELTVWAQSPFNTTYMNKYLSWKLEEFNFVDSYLTVVEEIKVVSKESELNRVVLDPTSDFIVCLNFASLDNEDQYLKDLKSWLEMDSFGEKVYDMKKITPWYKDQCVFQKARTYLKAFMAFYKVNKSSKETQFIVTSSPDLENSGVSIYLFDKGNLVNKKFSPPAKSNPLVIRTYYDSVELKFSPAAFGAEEIKGYQVEYQCREEKNWRMFRTKDIQEKTMVKKLIPNIWYQFRYAAVCLAGIGEFSDTSDFEKTKPTGPPGRPNVSHFRMSDIVLRWKEPSIKGKGVRISDYKVEYKRESKQGDLDNPWIEQTTGHKKEACEITGLKKGASYRFRVSALCGEDGASDASEEVVIVMQPGEQRFLVTCRAC
ncbi:verrucotoxin subunit beta-like [Pelodytes ibericus]